MDQVIFGEEGNAQELLTISGISRIRNVASVLSPHQGAYQAYLEQIQWLGTQRQGALLLEPALWLGQVKKEYRRKCYLRTIYVLPDYISLFKPGTTFDNSLKKLVKQYWPVPIENNIQRKSFAIFSTLIPHYIAWHNSPSLPAEESEQTSPDDGRGAVTESAVALSWMVNLVVDPWAV